MLWKRLFFTLLLLFCFVSTYLLSQRHTVAYKGKTLPSSICLPACLPAGLKLKPRLSRSLRRGDWHSGGRGLSASCTGHYSRRITLGCLDPHCQHINLSVSWIHQSHHRVADTVMDNCCASFLFRLFSFILLEQVQIPQCSFSTACSVPCFNPDDGSSFLMNWNIVFYLVNLFFLFLYKQTDSTLLVDCFL